MLSFHIINYDLKAYFNDRYGDWKIWIDMGIATKKS